MHHATAEMPSVNNNHPSFEVSAVVLTYNCDFSSLKKTLLSLIYQKNVSMEIIVADDGSANNHRTEIEALFFENAFSDYRLVMNKQNAGTVKNYISGLTVAKGDFVKSISPGDYLVSESVMRDWLDYLKKSGLDWSFSDAIYYDAFSPEFRILCVDARPRDIRPYLLNDRVKCRWNYVVFDDIAMGATMLGRTELKLEYCRRLAEKGVLLAEDNMFRLMMFDGVSGVYYPRSTVFYEFGDGVSTSLDGHYAKRLREDWQLTDEIMQSTACDPFQKKMLQEKAWLDSPWKKWLVNGTLRRAILRRVNARKTMAEIPKEVEKCKW